MDNYTNCYMVRMGEIFLKGKNKKLFENRLVGNINYFLRGSEYKLVNKRNRVYVYSNEELDFKKIFGITSYSLCKEITIEDNKDIMGIKEGAMDYLSDLDSKNPFKTFKIGAKRVTKDFFMTSPEINKETADFICEKSGKIVDMKDPDIVLSIEIYGKKAYFFDDTVKCFGGLPTGVEGKALLLVEEKDSIVAGLLMMKRGCLIRPIAFKEMDISLLQRYSPSTLDLKIIKDADEIPSLIRGDIKGVVTDKRLSGDISDIDSVFTLKPLAAFTEEEVDNLRGEFNEIDS